MAMNDNSIQKMEFQIEIDRDSDFDLLSKEIPAIVSDHLEDYINHCIQKLGLGNQFFILNQLVLDLGVLDISNFKNDLRAKFELQFFDEIKKQINKNSFAKIPDEELTFSIFVFFISNGGRPWWLNNQVKHFGEFAEKAFVLKAPKFITHLKFFFKHPVQRKRIIENLPEDLLVRALIHDKKMDSTNSSKSIYAIKRFLKHKYKYWNESKISLAFKEIVIKLFLHPNRIDQPWKLNLAIVEAIQDNHPEIQTLDSPANSFLRNASSLPQTNTFGLSLMEKPERISSSESEYVLIQGFQFYLENGYTKIGKIDHHYKYQNINTLFSYLISSQLSEIAELLLSLGRRSFIKKRFLESISQELMYQFFTLIAPSKKKLLAWVVEVFQKVQEEYKPINQTFINVKKSINEITFELFLNKKLTSVNDENYLRFLFKQTARKFGIKYRDLLFFTIKSLEKGNKRTSVFNFSQTMTLIYAKDILKSKGNSRVDKAIFAMNRPDARADDYRSKDFIYNLFLDLYEQTQQTSESQVGIWLKSKLESMSIDNTSDLLSLWELFAAKFELRAELLLLPVLVDKHRNPSIQLSAKSFDFWKNKYKLSGIYARKKPDEYLLVKTLHEYKKRLSRKALKGILMSLRPVDRVERLDFQVISNLIHSGVSPMIPIYLNWLEKVLLDSQLQFKKRTVYNWFLQQLLVLPKKDLTLVRLQKITIEFLQVDDGLIHEDDSKVQKSLPTIERIMPGNAHYVESQQRLSEIYPQQFTQAFFRIVELIGRADVLGIFQDSQRYGDKILFQMLTSKYKSQFFNLLKKHQFNKELRDYILIQSPGWLKKDLIKFINKASAGSWNSTVTSIRQHIGKNRWIRLEGLYLNDYIEKVLWEEIFDGTTFVFEDLIAIVMQQALVEDLVTDKFWSDYHHFRTLVRTGAPLGISLRVNEIAVLEESGFLSYIDALSKPQVSNGSSKQILESILFDFDFPIGHSFEEYQVEEFQSYINALIDGDKKVLIDILRNVDSPLVLQRFLALLDESTLRFLIRENQKQLGFSLIFKKIEAIFSLYNIKNKTKINSFFTAWIGVLYFEIRITSNLSNVYARMFRVLEVEDVLTQANVYSQNDWKPLLEILQLDEKEEVLFFKELGWPSGDRKEAQLDDSTDQILRVPLTEANFKSYISDLPRVDNKVIGELLVKVESPVLIQRLLKLLDESTLRFLIQEQHDILGFPSLLNQIESVFSIFKVKNKAHRIDFFTVWIGVLYFIKPGKTSRMSIYGILFRAFSSEGILREYAEISGIKQKVLMDILGLQGGEEVRFFEEIGWRVSDKKIAQIDESTEQILRVPLTEANFKSYISDLPRVDKRVIGELLRKVESPVLIQRLLKLLDESTLRFLIQEQHDILGFPSLLNQIESVFSIFKVKNKAHRIDFFTVWIGVLYFIKPGKTSRMSMYGSLFRVLASEGILGKHAEISGIEQEALMDILGLQGGEEVRFFEEIGWRVSDKKIAQLDVSTEQILRVPLTEANFKSYISDLPRVDKRVIGELLSRVESPVLIQRLLKLLDESTLRFLMQEQHDIIGFPSLLNQIESVFSIFKVKNKAQRIDFFTVWIGVLYFIKPGKTSRMSIYGRLFRVLASEGVLREYAEFSGIEQKVLMDILGLQGGEEVRFFKEIGWRVSDKKIAQLDESTDQILRVPLTEANFKSYISDLPRVDKRVIGELLSRVESPVLIQRLLKLLDESTLRFLIQEQYDILGFPSLLNQIEAIFLIFKIKSKAQRIDFFTLWIGLLYFTKSGKTSRSSMYVRLFRVLEAEGILGKEVFISDIDQKTLMDILQLDRNDKVLILRELSGETRIQKSDDTPEKASGSPDNFLHGRDPVQLILYPNNLSFEHYKLFIEYLFEEGIFNYTHRACIQQWVTFSSHYQSKKYLQMIVRLYFLNRLKFTSNATSMKALLLYAFVENLNLNISELRLFFSRLSFMPSLISGIPWVLMQEMRKADLGIWKKIWSDVNAKMSLDLESEDRHVLSFNLLMNYGKSFFENQQDFRNEIPYLSKLISEAPLSELFMYRLHPDLFHEFLKIKPAKEIQNYFLEGRDPYLKALKEKGFLVTWFKIFFESSNEIQKAKFLGLFHKSFYSNVYTNTQQNLNTFLKGFFRLQEGQKSFWTVIEKKPEEVELFSQAHSEFFGSLKLEAKISVEVLSPLEIFQMFLETGMLPKGMSGIQQLAKDLSGLKGNDLKKLRIVIHAGLQSEKGKKYFYKFAAYLDLTWFLKLIHQDLPKELEELISHVNKKARLDMFADLRISKKLDKLIFIAERWSVKGVLIKRPTEILLGMVEKWVDSVDSEVIKQIFSSDHQTPESLTILKNSSSKLKRVIDELATEEEKEMVKMPPVEIEPIDYEEGVSIGNAGLILFWPFYGRFFNALGMVGREGMKGEKIRERAIQLLQYIATGKTEFEEWDLTLNKILCGATPDFPVSPSIDLSAEEEELCGKLIKGSIYNWEKMRGTRMETFRETFVAREGRLYRKENRWELIVDKKAYDVLLDTLTWNISMINLSWMNTRINVQWR